MARSTGFRLLADALRQAGVVRVHGTPRALDPEAWRAISRVGLDGAAAATEIGAAFMAIGEALRSGRPAVVALGARPAVALAGAALAQAREDGVPLVVLVEPPGSRPREALDQDPELGVLVKGMIPVPRPERIPDAVASALRHALSGSPGPVALIVPREVLAAPPLADAPAPERRHATPPRDADHAGKMERILRALRSAERVGLYFGAGALGAGEGLTRLAERMEAPVATTISGRGAIPEDHALAVGYGYGPAGSPWAARIFRDCDVVLAIGAGFSEAATGAGTQPRPKRLLHADVAADEHGKRIGADVAIVVDAASFVAELCERLPQSPRDPAFRARLAKARGKHAASLARGLRDDGVQAELLISRLRSRLPADGTVVLDDDTLCAWALWAFPVRAPRTLLVSANFRCPGFALPGAIGAALARPDRPVVCLTTERGLAVSGLELRTACDLRLPIAVLVVDAPPGRARERKTESLDLRAFAQAVGARAASIATDFELDQGLDAALALGDRPTLCRVRLLWDRVPQYIRATATRLPIGGRVRHAAAAVVGRLIPGR